MKRKLFVLFLYLALIIQPSQADWIYNPFTQKFSYYEPTGAAAIHAANHEAGGADVVNHDNLTGFVIGEHFLQSAIAVDANELTNTAGSLGLADHDTARAALGLAIGTDIPALAHPMASHSDDDTYDISTSGTAAMGALTLSGALTLEGSATVERHIRVGAANWSHGSAAPAAGFWSVFPTIDFDAVSDDEAHYTLTVPYSWDGVTDIVFMVDWAHEIASTAGVTWALEYRSIKAGEAIGGVTVTLTESSGATAINVMQRTTFNPCIAAGDLEADDTIGLRLYRDVSDAGDTLAGDARLLNTHFHIIMNKLGKSS